MSTPALRRYFDNAATTHPKPPGVAQAMVDYLERVGASAGRGAYAEAVESGRMLAECRDAIRSLVGAAPGDAVIFALNGTDALNIALKSVLRPGDHVVTTMMEHNSVLRPLHALAARGVTLAQVPCDPITTLLDPADFEAAIRPGTALLVLNHASNVTGAIQPFGDVAEIAQRRRIPLLLDAAQTAGHVPIHLGTTPADLVAFPGHKGLLGPQGTGALLIRAGFEHRMSTFREGGTGSRSEIPRQPDTVPDKFEAGSHNGPGLAGLLAALRWLLARGVDALRRHEIGLSQTMLDRLAAVPGLRVYGPADPGRRVGVFSLRLDGVDPQELSSLLEARFGILSRSGLHCAPTAHALIGTAVDGGTTRLSFGPFTTGADLDAACQALREAAGALIS